MKTVSDAKPGTSKTLQELQMMSTVTLFIGPRCPWGPIYGSGSLSLIPRPFADLTDVTLVDEDTK